MTTRLEYLLGMANDRSDWLLTSNPSLNYILVKDSGSLMYPEPSVAPLNRFFSTSGLTTECDECFNKAAQDLETKLKLANNMSDTYNDLSDSDMFDITLSVLFDLGVLIGNNFSLFYVMWEAIEEAGLASLSSAEMAELRAAFDTFVKTLKEQPPSKDDIEFWKSELNRYNDLANKPHYPSNRPVPGIGHGPRPGLSWEDWHKLIYEQEKAFNSAKAIEAEKTLKQLLERQAESKSAKIARSLSSGLLQALKKTGLDLIDLFAAIIAKCFKQALRLLTGLGIAAFITSLYYLMNRYAKEINDRCIKNQNDQKDIIAQMYLDADQYFRDVAKCNQAGCCDDPDTCKGIGGWCTRIRNGVDFSFYIPCCSNCNCGDDPECEYAFCSSCNPDSKCPGKEDDLDTNDTQTGSQTESLPNYLFAQDPPEHLQNCPPLPPGWQRHSNGDPDPRSSANWSIPEIPSCPSDVTDGISDVWNWFLEFYGIDGDNGGKTTTVAD